MNKLSFDPDDKGWELLFNLKWPHQGFSIGYELIQPTDEDPYATVMIFLGLLTIIYSWE